MEICDIEIDCDECRGTMDRTDKCYCETCLEKKDDEISALEKKVESLEIKIINQEEEITALTV